MKKISQGEHKTMAPIPTLFIERKVRMATALNADINRIQG
jgi:hypothetical protein